MRKYGLEKGNKRGAISRTKTSHTSPAQIRIQERRQRALEYRKLGYAYPRIAKEMQCARGTAFNYVAEAIRQAVSRETAETVLQLELLRLDELFTVANAKVLAGDMAAAAECRKQIELRCKLVGAYPGGPHQSLVNINMHSGNSNLPDAEVSGIKIIFVNPTPQPEETEKIINGKLLESSRLVERPALDNWSSSKPWRKG
jgi:hypothetical protein